MARLPRFSLRTSVILAAMLAALVAARPYVEVKPIEYVIAPGVPIPPPQYGLTERFRNVAMFEGVILAVWAWASWRKRHPRPELVVFK